jgi:uncharacterized membrane protein
MAVTDLPQPPFLPRPSRSSMASRWALVAGAGLVAGLTAGFLAPWQTVPLLGWDAGAVVWLASVWWRIARLDAPGTSGHAIEQEPRRPTVDALLLTACVVSLVAVLLGVVKASSSHGGTKAVLVGAGIATIVISWAVVHTLFTLRYAALYYTGPDGGVNFNEDDKPSYLDFAYMAFTIGMTYQVSDTDLTTKAIRHTALRHALLSYLFGTVIIAATINLVAGLVK